jgi:hypothetical protein
MTLAEVRERIATDFWLEGFRDFLALAICGGSASSPPRRASAIQRG